MRLLPDAERLVLALLRPAFPAVSFGTLIPDDIATRLPYVVVRRAGGAAIDTRFIDQPVVSVDVWHASKDGASDLAEDIRVALVLAWEQQAVTDVGHLAGMREDAGPAELVTNDQPDTLFRYQASYALATRPPRRADPVPTP